MRPIDDEPIDFDTSLVSPFAEAEVERQTEVVAPRRSALGLVGAVAVVIGLGWLVVNGGSDLDDGALPPTTLPPTTLPSEPAPPPIAGPVVAPRVEGQLRSGTPFEVYEQTPGVLCAVFPDGVGGDGSSEICHLELPSASGPAVIDGALVFGYLPPESASASLRYRTGNIGTEGVRLEPSARFFALPIRAQDPYRLQYRDDEFDVVEEIPLVALRGGPSQPPTDAARDGIPAEIAALPFNRRVAVLGEWTYAGRGPFAWSASSDEGVAPGWSELLLLDDTGTEILRSTPLPGLQLRAHVSTDDALFLVGVQLPKGDSVSPEGAAVVDADLPVAVVRIEHDTGETLVRVYASSSRAVTDRPGWEPGPDGVSLSPDVIGATGRRLRLETSTIEGDGESIQLDQVTLLPL